MELSGLASEKYLSVTERYFTQKYYKNPKNDGEDVCVLVHSNKICVICLAETHPVCKDKKKVLSVDYQFDDVNRLCNKVSGKGKKASLEIWSGNTVEEVRKTAHLLLLSGQRTQYDFSEYAHFQSQGGQNLTPGAFLCRISCEDGTQYFIPCGLKCQLLETNDNLKNTPNILTEKPLSEGYIAIVMPKLKEFPEEIEKLQTRDTFIKDVKT